MGENRIKPLQEVKFSEIKLVQQAYLTDWLCGLEKIRAQDIDRVLINTVVEAQIIYGEAINSKEDACSEVWQIIRKEDRGRRHYFLICFEVWTEETTGIYDKPMDLTYPLQVWGKCLCSMGRDEIDYSSDMVPSFYFKDKTLTKKSYMEQCRVNKEYIQQEIQKVREKK